MARHKLRVEPKSDCVLRRGWPEIFLSGWMDCEEKTLSPLYFLTVHQVKQLGFLEDEGRLPCPIPQF